MNPYEPPKGDITPPPKPARRGNEGRDIALGIGAVGTAITVRVLWSGKWDWIEGTIGTLLLMIAFGVLWRRSRDYSA